MSLQEDLEKNRVVFEKLTGTAREEKSKTAPKCDVKAPRDNAQDEYELRRNSFELQEPEYESERKPRNESKYESEQIKSFSLTYGPGRFTSVSFEPPESVEHPGLSEKSPVSGTDPLEALYYQLEVEARRASQLNREEDFFE